MPEKQISPELAGTSYPGLNSTTHRKDTTKAPAYKSRRMLSAPMLVPGERGAGIYGAQRGQHRSGIRATIQREIALLS